MFNLKEKLCFNSKKKSMKTNKCNAFFCPILKNEFVGLFGPKYFRICIEFQRKNANFTKLFLQTRNVVFSQNSTTSIFRNALYWSWAGFMLFLGQQVINLIINSSKFYKFINDKKNFKEF